MTESPIFDSMESMFAAKMKIAAALGLDWRDSDYEWWMDLFAMDALMAEPAVNKWLRAVPAELGDVPTTFRGIPVRVVSWERGVSLVSKGLSDCGRKISFDESETPADTSSGFWGGVVKMGYDAWTGAAATATGPEG